MPEPLTIEQIFTDEDKRVLAEHRFQVLRLMKEGREIYLRANSNRLEPHRRWFGSLWSSKSKD